MSNRNVWEKDGTCWEICGNVSKRLRHPDKQNEEKCNIEHSSSTKVKILKIRSQIKKLPISLTITKEQSDSNIYPDNFVGDNKWKYYEDLDRQNSHKIQIGAHLHYRQKKSTQYKFIGIVIEKIFGGTSNITNKRGQIIGCDYYILTIHSKEKSLGLDLHPNTIVPVIGNGHPLCIRLKKDGSPRRNINGAMRYQYDSCSNSGITTIHTAPQRGILY